MLLNRGIASLDRSILFPLSHQKPAAQLIALLSKLLEFRGDNGRLGIGIVNLLVGNVVVHRPSLALILQGLTGGSQLLLHALTRLCERLISPSQGQMFLFSEFQLLGRVDEHGG